MVNSLAESETTAEGTVTLRAAVAQAAGTSKTIAFAPALNGETIELSIVGENHSILKGEVYSGMTFQGYADRDYGRSALYAFGNLAIDASALPDGITIAWTGGDANPARVLAVYGNLNLNNVTITGGYSVAEPLTEGTQGYTLARGGGIAVWGTARLQNCSISGNRILGDNQSSRDRGTYGGGIYADGLHLSNCVVSGNSAKGYGAAGGGIYSVGGGANLFGQGNEVYLDGCTISGNRVTAQHAYGGGLFTLGGGPANLATLHMTNCTVARNLAEDNPDLENPEGGQWYTRGGGIYMGGGSLSVVSSTIVENAVTGIVNPASTKPNLGGGGIAATIGNAHVVEILSLGHSIIAGNKLNGGSADIFAGSLLHFTSNGYNLIGSIDFSQILVPAPPPASGWLDLSRKHYPKIGDQDGVALADAVTVDGAQYDSSIVSAGTDSGSPAVLWYPPATAAIDRVPTGAYTIGEVFAGYSGYGTASDDFLVHVLDDLRTNYADVLGSDFGIGYEPIGITWYGPSVTWPSNSQNLPWIKFWRDLDTAIAGRMGTAGLEDEYWFNFPKGALLPELTMTILRDVHTVTMVDSDQLKHSRPAGEFGDIGAIEAGTN